MNPTSYALLRRYMQEHSPGHDPGWSHFVDVALRHALEHHRPPLNHAMIWELFACGAVPFKRDILSRVMDDLEE